MLQDFVDSPWSKNNIHDIYSSSFLHMRPAPEYASGEVVLASTYRQVGFATAGISESKVPSLGKDLHKRLNKGKFPSKTEETGSGLDAESFSKIITGTLRSPKQPNQAAKRFLQISPVVPDAAIYSLSARLSSNSWNPGALVSKIIQYGESNLENAQERWNYLFHSLSVGDEDDIWARFLQQEFIPWRKLDSEKVWVAPTTLESDDVISAWHTSSVSIPATRFSKDLSHILSLKQYLTRRQWISMLESTLRIGTASHILWLCNSNSVCFHALKNTLEGKNVPDQIELEKIFSVGEGYWRFGQYAANTINDAATGYVKSRLGLNLILHQLENDLGKKIEKNSLSSISHISKFLEYLSTDEVRSKFNLDTFRDNYQSILENDPRQVSGKKGISSNVKEFLRHVLGQRQTSEAGMDNYDQGFFLAKKGHHKSARWIVSLGPVSVLALVHACTHGTYGPRTIDNLCHHLGEYGIDIRAQEVSSSALGATLRNLGLVLDSPDAEGGMVLINPFEHMLKEGK